MKLPHHVAGAALALALAACSGAQNGATPMTVPNGGSGSAPAAALTIPFRPNIRPASATPRPPLS